MKCKYCRNPAEMKGYRGNNDCVSSEIVCFSCNNMTNEELSHRYPRFKEGDDYWAIEENVGGVSTKFCTERSCWDDQSEELTYPNEYNNPVVFKSLEDALSYAKFDMKLEEITVFFPQQGAYVLGLSDDYGNIRFDKYETLEVEFADRWQVEITTI